MKRLSLLVLLGALPLAASAQVLYSENFDADHTSAWTYNSSVPGDTATDGSGGSADFFFDYSTMGIPSASGTGGTTRGLKMQANIFNTLGVAGVFSGMSVSPNGQNFSGNYTLAFDSWQNFDGPLLAGGTGSTQFTTAGFSTGASAAAFPDNGYGSVGFAATGDGNNATDYRAYNGTTVQSAATVFTAGSQANSNGYYTSKFLPQTATAAQLAAFPQQTGSTNAGSLGMAWHHWTISKSGTTYAWFVDGYSIASVTNATFAGNNIFFGQFDPVASTAGDAISQSLLFGLIDNVTVTANPVPEPGTWAAFGLGALALVRRRRKV